MPCCAHCEGVEEQFGEKTARRELRRYRRKGPIRSTRELIDALRARGVEGLTLLDVGGGVGAVQHELFGAGLRGATQVDASSHYLRASRDEAERRGNVGRTEYLHGDFVELAGEIPPADVVVLDRVICCYPDMEALVAASASRARRWYAVVYPRERLGTRLLLPLGNLFLRLRGTPFRVFLHPTDRVDAAIRRQGLAPRERRTTFVWQIWLYERVGQGTTGD